MRNTLKFYINKYSKSLKIVIKFLSLFDLNFYFLDISLDSFLTYMSITDEQREFFLKEIEKNTIEFKEEQAKEAEMEAKAVKEAEEAKAAEERRSKEKDYLLFEVVASCIIYILGKLFKIF